MSQSPGEQEDSGRSSGLRVVVSPEPTPSFRAIFDEHIEYVLRSLLRLGVHDHDADDLAQEVFIVLHRRLQELDLARPLKPYVFGIAFNVIRGYRNRQRRRRVNEVPPQRDRGKSDPNLRALLAADLVHRALATLDEETRAVVILRDLDDCSAKEIAKVLRVPVDTVYGRLRRGREAFAIAVRRLKKEVR